MTNRGIVGHVFSTLVLAAALWAWSGGVASAQNACGCTDDVCPPCPFVTCAPPPECTEGCPQPSPGCSAFYTPDQKVKVFTFGTDNSLQVKFGEVCPAGFNVTVTLVPTNQATFHDRLKSLTCTSPPSPLTDDGIGPPEVLCNETVVQGEDQTGFCAVYRVSVAPTDYSCFGSGVEYLVGWKAPAKGNKHDYFLLRDPDALDLIAPDIVNCFTQNITDGTVIRNYVVGDIRDPGLGGRACCPSDYVVVRQKIRPVAK